MWGSRRRKKQRPIFFRADIISNSSRLFPRARVFALEFVKFPGPRDDGKYVMLCENNNNGGLIMA